MITACLSCLATEEVSTRNMVLPLKLIRRIQEEPSEGEDASPSVLSTSQNPLRWGTHLGWEICIPPGRTLSQTMGQRRWLARHNLETNPITIKSEAASHVAEQFSWVALPCCFPPGRPFPVKSLASSAPLLGQFVSGKDPPSCDTGTIRERKEVLVLGYQWITSLSDFFFKKPHQSIFRRFPQAEERFNLWSPHKRCFWGPLVLPKSLLTAPEF